MKKYLFILLLVMIFASCADKPLVIIQVADAQLGFDAAIKGQQPGAVYVNDLSYEAEYLRKAVTVINELSPDVVIYTGDQVNIVDNEEQWQLFTEIISGIDADILQLHIPGNHDVAFPDGKVDSAPFVQRFGSDRFVSDHGDVRLVGINSNLIKYDAPAESEHREWLETVLSETPAENVKIIFSHHPFFITDVDEEDSYFPIQRAKRRDYFDMFAANGVDAVFAGHLHDNSAGEYEGIPMLTTTSSGYQLGTGPASIRVITIKDGQMTEELVPII